MTIYIIAQLIGFAGYLFYISAPHFKTQSRIIQADALACLFISVQWYLLEQPTLLVFSFLSIAASIITLKAQTDMVVRKYLFLLYPLGCITLMAISQNTTISALAIIAFCMTVASKSSQNIISFRKYAGVSGIVLTIAGILTLSIPAVIFNLLFTSGHILKLWQGSALKIPHADTKKSRQTFAGQPFTQ